MSVIELMEKAKKRANIESDYALAKAMGLDRKIISAWRNGKRHPSTEEAVQLATLAGLDEMMVIAQIEYESANKPEKKRFWKHYIESRGITAIGAMVILGGSLLIAPDPSEANILQFGNYGAYSHVQNKAGIYIMRISGTGNAV
jgi:plasmid maintenance system antidote protein VapI